MGFQVVVKKHRGQGLEDASPLTAPIGGLQPASGRPPEGRPFYAEILDGGGYATLRTGWFAKGAEAYLAALELLGLDLEDLPSPKTIEIGWD
jgi:hypothetical protein